MTYVNTFGNFQLIFRSKKSDLSTAALVAVTESWGETWGETPNV